MGMGHAAGVAAAMAVKEGVACRDVDGTKVREELIAQGVGLDQPPMGEYWKAIRESGKEPVIAVDMAMIIPDGMTF